MSDSFEEQLSASVDAFLGEDTPLTGESDEPEIQAPTPTPASAPESRELFNSTDSGAAPAETTPAPTTPKEPAAGQQQQADLRSDSQGNLVNEKGQVVVAAGAQRRLFDERNHARRSLYETTEQNKQLQQQLQQLSQAQQQQSVLTQTTARLGLQGDDGVNALQLYANLKADPVGTANQILTHLRNTGHNVGTTVQDDGTPQPPQGVTLQQLDALISQKLAPFTSAQQQQADSQSQEAELRQRVAHFFGTYPDAELHQEAIAGLVKQKGFAPEKAYYELKTWAIERGLDWSQPLGPQLARRQASTQTRPTQQPAAHSQPVPHGLPGQATRPIGDVPSSMANPDDSWATIIQQSMREAGAM